MIGGGYFLSNPMTGLFSPPLFNANGRTSLTSQSGIQPLDDRYFFGQIQRKT